MIESCEYSPRLRSSVLELAGREEVGERIWEWQFEDNPRGLPFQPVILRERDTGDVVGFNGVMPVRVQYRDEEVIGCWSCDFHVRSDFRGQGVGRQVKDTLHARYPLLMTFGVSASASRILPRVGWRSWDGVRQYRKLRVPGTCGDWVRIAAQRMNQICSRLTARQKSYQSLQTYLTKALPAADTVNALWQRARAGYSKIVCRDHTYLEWRYERCPVGRYRFITVYDGEDLRALAVYRHEGRLSRLVDLVAHHPDEAARAAVIEAWLRASEVADALSLVTSDKELGRQAACHGFFRGSGTPGFFVRSELGDDTPEKGWFIMAGDSDGEFLQAAWDTRAGERDPDTVQLYQLTPDECFGAPSQWENLVNRSGVNPMFMGWAWQSAWWSTWHQRLGLEPMLLSVFVGERLVGLAPLYRYERRILPGYTTRELHLIGNAPGIAPTVRTEYTDILIDPDYRDIAANRLTTALLRIQWDILAISDYVTPGHLDRCVKHLRGWRMQRKLDKGTRLTVSGNVSNWLASLSQNTRRQIYNQRRQLKTLGSLVGPRELGDNEAGLDILNRFHRQRWDRAAFEGASLAFHRRFLAQLPREAEPHFSCLEADGRAISLLYDVRFGGTVYNIQMGFDETFDRRLSLGTLHLGYAVEAAFNNQRISEYDFLAGGGKKTNYKTRFRGQEIVFESFSIVRRPSLRAIYAIYYSLPARWQDDLGRWAHRRLRT